MASSSRLIHIGSGKPGSPYCGAREWGNASLRPVWSFKASEVATKCEACLDKLALIELGNTEL